MRISALLLLILASGAAPAAGEPLRIRGSGSMQPILRDWIELHQASHPEVRVETRAGGSAKAPRALIDGRAEIGAMTRPMNAAEREAFRRLRGAEPLELPVAIDGVAVFVNERNPLESLTLAQVDAIFSETRRCGSEHPVRRWDDLGVGGEFAGRAIGRFSRTSASGTRRYFQNVALCGGLFRDDTRVQPGAASNAMAVAESTFGIGYGSRADLIPGIKALALARDPAQPFVGVAPDDVYSGAYPLARRLYLYLVPGAEGALDPAAAAFAAHALSEAGQQVVAKHGYLPVPAALARQSLAALPRGSVAAPSR